MISVLGFTVEKLEKLSFQKIITNCFNGTFKIFFRKVPFSRKRSVLVVCQQFFCKMLAKSFQILQVFIRNLFFCYEKLYFLNVLY
jgi:hypothetical protein